MSTRQPVDDGAVSPRTDQAAIRAQSASTAAAAAAALAKRDSQKAATPFTGNLPGPPPRASIAGTAAAASPPEQDDSAHRERSRTGPAARLLPLPTFVGSTQSAASTTPSVAKAIKPLPPGIALPPPTTPPGSFIGSAPEGPLSARELTTPSKDTAVTPEQPLSARPALRRDTKSSSTLMKPPPALSAPPPPVLHVASPLSVNPPASPALAPLHRLPSSDSPTSFAASSRPISLNPSLTLRPQNTTTASGTSFSLPPSLHAMKPPPAINVPPMPQRVPSGSSLSSNGSAQASGSPGEDFSVLPHAPLPPMDPSPRAKPPRAALSDPTLFLGPPPTPPLVRVSGERAGGSSINLHPSGNKEKDSPTGSYVGRLSAGPSSSNDEALRNTLKPPPSPSIPHSEVSPRKPKPVRAQSLYVGGFDAIVIEHLKKEQQAQSALAAQQNSNSSSSILSPRSSAGASRINARWRNTASATQLAQISPAEIQRQEVVFELISTERQYVDTLNMLLSSFCSPIREQSLLSKEDFSKVFLNLDSLYELNSKFLRDLEEVQKENVVVASIGPTILQWANQFKIYATYCANQSGVSDLIEELKASNKKFAAFLEDMSGRAESRGLPLQAHLAAPVQRICKYPLLMREMLSNMDQEHVDWLSLSEARTAVEDIVNKINARARQVENVKRLEDLSQKLSKCPKTLDLMQWQRRLLHEGDLRLLNTKSSTSSSSSSSASSSSSSASSSKKEKEKAGEVYWFLFSDLLLEAKRKEKQPGNSTHQKGDDPTPPKLKYKYLRHFALAGIFLRDLPQDHEGFEVHMTGGDFERVSFSSREQKQKWLSELTAAIDAHQKHLDAERQTKAQLAQAQDDLKRKQMSTSDTSLDEKSSSSMSGEKEKRATNESELITELKRQIHRLQSHNSKLIEQLHSLGVEPVKPPN